MIEWMKAKLRGRPTEAPRSGAPAAATPLAGHERRMEELLDDLSREVGRVRTMKARGFIDAAHRRGL